jgi:hypothetical protein
VSLRAFAPDDEYYGAMPEMPEMPADFYIVFAWEEERRRALLAGEGSSGGGGARRNLFSAGEGSSGGGGARRDLIFVCKDEEEATALAQAMAESEAKLAAMAEVEQEEQAHAITEVQAFIAREAEQVRSMTNWVILDKAREANAAGAGKVAATVDLGNPRLVLF